MSRKLTIKEFAAATSQKEGTIRQHIHRKMVKKGRDGLISVDTDFHKAYINDVTNGAGLYAGVVKEKPVTKAKSVTDDEVVKEKTPEQNFFQDLVKRKTLAEAELKEREAELKRIEIEKRAGNLLPVDFILNAMVINVQTVIKNFEAELDNLNSIYVEKLGGTRKDLAEIKERQRKCLDVALVRAKEEARHEIEAAVTEHQDVRGVGQRR